MAQFEWDCNDSAPAFPIDYSQRGLARCLGEDPRSIHRYIAAHTWFQDKLEDQFYREDAKITVKDRRKNAAVSIPVESALFFKCYHKLAAGKYHKAMCAEDPKRMEAILPEFTHELCRLLREEIEKENAGSCYYRRVLYGNSVFQKESMTDFWEQELDRRVETLKHLAKGAEAGAQLGVLMDNILNLDRSIINLQRAKRTPLADGEHGGVPGMLDALVQRTVKEVDPDSKNCYATYLVEDMPLPGQNKTLHDAFDELNATTKRPEKLEILEKCARERYLQHLDAADGEAPFEAMYKNAAAYLKPETGPEQEKLLERLVEARCKQYCMALLDRCRIVSEPPAAEPDPAFARLQYVAILADGLVNAVFGSVQQRYDETIRLISCLHMVRFGMEHREKHKEAAPEEVQQALELVDRLCPEVDEENNLTFREALRFRSLFAAMWKQTGRRDLFDPETKRLCCPKEATEVICQAGREAVEFFGGKTAWIPHESEIVEAMLRRYDEIVSHPGRYYRYECTLEFAPPLLLFGLMLVLKDAVAEYAPMITSDMKQLLYHRGE